MSHHLTKEDLPYCHLQGVTANGIPAYSCNYDKVDPATDPLPEEEKKKDASSPAGSPMKKHFHLDMTRLGAKYQCVEMARRYMFETKGVILGDIMVAAMIFYIPHVFDAETLKPVPVKSHRNGGTTKPMKDSMIIYGSHIDNFPGHIGIIVDVDDDFVYVADQNREFTSWHGKPYAGKYELKKSKEKTSQRDGAFNYTIIDKEEPVVGWVEVLAPNKPMPRAHSPEVHSPKILRRDELFELHRPLPESVADGQFPEYHKGGMFSRESMWYWWKVMIDFRPHWVAFPLFFIWKVFYFLVYLAIKRWVFAKLGWDEQNKMKKEEEKKE